MSISDKELDAMVKKHQEEVKKEYEEIKSRIMSGEANSQDYVLILSYADLADEKLSKEQKQDYLRKAYNIAQTELLSSEDVIRENAYLTLARYYEELKDYQNALKNYDNAVKLNPSHIVLRARFRVLSMHDKKGAEKDYELAKSMHLSEEELKLFKILVDDAGGVKWKLQVFFIYFWLVVTFIVFALYTYIKFFK